MPKSKQTKVSRGSRSGRDPSSGASRSQIPPFTSDIVSRVPFDVLDLIFEHYCTTEEITDNRSDPPFIELSAMPRSVAEFARLSLVSKQWLPSVMKKLYQSVRLRISGEQCRLFLKTLRESEKLRLLVAEIRIEEGDSWVGPSGMENGRTNGQAQNTKSAPMTVQQLDELFGYCTGLKSLLLRASDKALCKPKPERHWIAETIEEGVFEGKKGAGLEKISIGCPKFTSLHLSIILSNANPTFLSIGNWYSSSNTLSSLLPTPRTTVGQSIRCLSIEGDQLRDQIPGTDLIHLFSLCPQLASFRLKGTRRYDDTARHILPEHLGTALGKVSGTVQHIYIDGVTPCASKIDYGGCLDSALKTCGNLKSFNVSDAYYSTDTLASLPQSVIHLRAPAWITSQPIPQLWITALSDPTFLPSLEDLRMDSGPPDPFSPSEGWNEDLAQTFINDCAGRERPVRVNMNRVGTFSWMKCVWTGRNCTSYESTRAMADREVMRHRTRGLADGGGGSAGQDWRFEASPDDWWKLDGPWT